MMRKKYKSILCDVSAKRDTVGEKPSGGYRLFERKKTIHLASSQSTKASATASRMWTLS